MLEMWCAIHVHVGLATTAKGGPDFVVHPRSAYIRRGGTAQLSCTPGPGFTVTGWLHDGRPLTARRRDHLIVSDGGLLTIKSFQHHSLSRAAEDRGSDEGLYQCVASGPQGALVSRPARLLTAGIAEVIEVIVPIITINN